MKIKLELELTEEQLDLLYYHFTLEEIKKNNYEELENWLCENDIIYQAEIKKIILDKKNKKLLTFICMGCIISM